MVTSKKWLGGTKVIVKVPTKRTILKIGIAVKKAAAKKAPAKKAVAKKAPAKKSVAKASASRRLGYEVEQPGKTKKIKAGR